MPKLNSGEAPSLRGFRFIERLTDVFRRNEGLAGEPIVFITEHGRYVPLDVRVFDKREGGAETQVLLIEESK